MLRLPVKINGVNNLSDARYCAGMGVEMIGFSISEKHERYLPNEKISGISGWITGVKIVSEGYLGENIEILTDKQKTIPTDLLEIEASFYKNQPLPVKEVIYRFDLAEWDTISRTLPSDAVVHVSLTKQEATHFEAMKLINDIHTSFFNVSHLDLGQIEELLLHVNPYGLSLDGGNELSPGLKDYEHLAEVLEYLEA